MQAGSLLRRSRKVTVWIHRPWPVELGSMTIAKDLEARRRIGLLLRERRKAEKDGANCVAN